MLSFVEPNDINYIEIPYYSGHKFYVQYTEIIGEIERKKFYDKTISVLITDCNRITLTSRRSRVQSTRATKICSFASFVPQNCQ